MTSPSLTDLRGRVGRIALLGRGIRGLVAVLVTVTMLAVDLELAGINLGDVTLATCDVAVWLACSVVELDVALLG